MPAKNFTCFCPRSHRFGPVECLRSPAGVKFMVKTSGGLTGLFELADIRFDPAQARLANAMTSRLKNPVTALTLAIVAALFQIGSVNGAEPRDLRSDTWVATDALGRSLPTFEQVGPRRPNKYVGVFYFLWLGQAGDLGPFDITKILAHDPAAIHDPRSPLWGPELAPHHWGESIFGYYVSDDESVLAKHAQMLADADVDAIFFDVTNQLTYPQSWKALCRAFDRVKRKGNRVPQIAFLCPFGDPAKVVRELWNDLYSRNLYSDLWFRWEGKPLILADPATFAAGIESGRRVTTDALTAGNALGQTISDDPIRQFFTFRKPQPDYFQGPTGPRQWGWLEVYPQHAFYKTPGVPEEVAVGVAQNAADGKLSVFTNPRAHGRSFHDGNEPGPAARDGSRAQFRRTMAPGFGDRPCASSSSPTGTSGSPADSPPRTCLFTALGLSPSSTSSTPSSVAT